MKVHSLALGAFLLAASASARRTIYACPNTMLSTSTTTTTIVAESSTSTSVPESSSTTDSSTTASSSSTTTSSTSSTFTTLTTSTTTTTTTSDIVVPSTTTSTTSTTTSAAALQTYYLQARAASTQANGYYAQVVSGALQFVAAAQDTAAGFQVDAAGRLIYNGLYAQITPGTVSQVQFKNAVSSLTRRQAAATALTCTVIADNTGAAQLSCNSNGQVVPQVCGTSYYLGTTNQCVPLVIGFVNPGSATGVTPSPSGTASASFSLQSGTSGFYLVYAGTPSSVNLAFGRFGAGAPFNLDGSGRLVSIGPTQSGATVPYVATLPISIPATGHAAVVEQTGAVPDGFVPIICQLSLNAVTSATTLTCQDGASGVNTVMQVCLNVLHLGATLGTGCSAVISNVKYGS